MGEMSQVAWQGNIRELVAVVLDILAENWPERKWGRVRTRMWHLRRKLRKRSRGCGVCTDEFIFLVQTSAV